METYEFSYSFELGSLLIAPVHVRIEQLPPIIAAHQHSNISYEIHYTQKGRGDVTINAATRRVEPDTLYITGPGVTHAQRSDVRDPITEYCLYLNCRALSAAPSDPFSLFARTHFWMGRDGGRIFGLLEALIAECRRPGPGAREMTQALLMQIIIQLTRLYARDAHPHGRGRGLLAVHPHQQHDDLPQQRLGHLPGPGLGAAALGDQLFQQRVYPPAVLTHPEVGLGEAEKGVLPIPGRQLAVQVEAVFDDGVLGVRTLGVLNARAGDVQRIRAHAPGFAVDGHIPLPAPGVVELVADV